MPPSTVLSNRSNYYARTSKYVCFDPFALYHLKEPPKDSYADTFQTEFNLDVQNQYKY